MVNNIECRVGKVVKKVLSVDDISADEDLAYVGLTSITVIKLIMEIEAEFKFEFDDADLVVDKIRTIRKIVKMVEEKL